MLYWPTVKNKPQRNLQNERHPVNQIANDKPGNSASISISKISKCLQWWPVLLAPLSLLVLTFIAQQVDTTNAKRYSEMVSPTILGIATAVFALRSWRTRNPLYMVLTGLAVAFTCREIHFAGTTHGIKVALVILVIWTVYWRKRLFQSAGNVSHVRWVAASASMYAMSMIIAKRVFSEKHLGMIPNEKALHIPLEEGLELLAHLLLLLAAIMGSWKLFKLDNQPEKQTSDPKPQ